MEKTVFVSWPGYDAEDAETGRRLTDAGYHLRIEPKVGARSDDELIDLMGDAVAAIVSTDPFTLRAIQANPNLRIIARVGVGTDSIDHDAARSRGVAIATTPGLNAEPVADQALALILALVRKVVTQDSRVKAGLWERIGLMTPGELPGKIVGIVGAGVIGKAVARRLHGFGVSLIYHDAMGATLDHAERVATLNDLLERADIVTLHVPLLSSTRNLIDADALARMKRHALLINTSRGPLVDQAALFAALRLGQIGGAGLDVYAEEPPGAAVLKGVPNLVCSAHIGGLSHESIRRMTISATTSVLAVLNGEKPSTVINPEVL
jgi:phosphoglycerate dehydrogenase-like enzyme